MLKKIMLITLITAISYLSASPFPRTNRQLRMVETYDNIDTNLRSSQRPGWGNIPDSIMVFLVQFSDKTFDLEADHPDYIPHDYEYFHRLMFHLDAFYSDASHGHYELITETDSLYQIYPEIITLPNTMAYYGTDSSNRDQIENKVQIISDLIAIVDPDLDFSNYDSYMLFHAGAGQEGNPDNSDFIQSTYLSRKSFQAALDPENDEFPGILTDDGVYFKEISILPESENISNLEEGADILGILGVLAQSFGYQLGLPTLYDNNSSNGLSFGIGSFGVMGYGLWNAAGYVPPLPCAWSRYYMGWEEDNIIEITATETEIPIVYPMSSMDESSLYKINISEKEYFLIENRQQNPDNSYFVNTDGDTLVTFSFDLIDDQAYYAEGHPYAGQPIFDFMKNSYQGCEWDFYLPGFGYGDAPENDGSGLLIWHIDENIIEANFEPGYEINSVNADGTHKGVDLEEADGIQHLDGPYNPWYLGSPDDAYREGNNSYFGKLYTPQGNLSVPTSESYYGDSQLEITNISVSDTVMTFDVNFQWYLTSDYTGESRFNATIIDLDNDGEEEIFYPMPSGEIYLWDNFEMAANYPVQLDSIPYYYSLDEMTGTFLIPTLNSATGLSRLMMVDMESTESLYFIDRNWAAGPVVNRDNESPYRVFLPLNTNNNSFEIVVLDEMYESIETIAFADEVIVSNLVLNDDYLVVTSKNIYGQYLMRFFDPDNLSESFYNIIFDNIIFDKTNQQILSVQSADIDDNDSPDYIVTTADSLLYMFDFMDYAYNHIGMNSPVKMDFEITSLPSFADVDGNGTIDIILGEENSFTAVDYRGNIFKPESMISSPDSLNISSGAIAVNLDNDEQLEVVGNISRNRLAGWENINNNDYIMGIDFPFTYSVLSRNYPIIFDNNNNGSTIYIAADNGTIFRTDRDLPIEGSWMHEYGNLQRTASYIGESPVNQFLSDELFVSAGTYFYPNPLSRVFNSSIYNGSNRENTVTLKLLTSKNVEVSVKIFDIAGNLILSKEINCLAYLQSSLFIDAADMASGVYFAVIKGNGKILKKKFAIEK